MLTVKRLALLAGLGVSVALMLFLSGAHLKAQNKDQRLFELRIYTTHPGKLDALNKRFREHTNRIFKKHGMQLVGYWTPTEGKEKDNTLVYILAYPSREARNKAWAAFGKDPEWQKVFRESRANGPLVKKVQSKFLTPTDYSPIK